MKEAWERVLIVSAASYSVFLSVMGDYGKMLRERAERLITTADR